MKSKKTNPFVITTLIFFMTTVMFGLLTTSVIIKYRKSTVATNTDKLSNAKARRLPGIGSIMAVKTDKRTGA